MLNYFSNAPLVLTVAVVVTSVSAANQQSAGKLQVVTDERTNLLEAYNNAIYDASVYKFSNLRPLFPLKFNPTTRAAIVVTATNFPYKRGVTKLPVDVWVTVVPEVQNKCRNFKGDVAVRLGQLLGLHPEEKVDSFVTISVKEGDIFRPTSNPDPTTTIPCSYPVSVDCGEKFPEGVSESHVRWMANQMLSSYVLSESDLIPKGYPWTRPGYTYDWGPGSQKYGASEYVIRRGSTVTIADITPYKSYCSSPE